VTRLVHRVVTCDAEHETVIAFGGRALETADDIRIEGVFNVRDETAQNEASASPKCGGLPVGDISEFVR
jgi:hypothetical protein